MLNFSLSLENIKDQPHDDGNMVVDGTNGDQTTTTTASVAAIIDNNNDLLDSSSFEAKKVKKLKEK